MGAVTVDRIASTWTNAEAFCTSLGGGARLPEVKELLSLVDYSKFSPALPEGHPFQDVELSWYWSATALAEVPSSYAWVVAFSDGTVDHSITSVVSRTWCVR